MPHSWEFIQRFTVLNVYRTFHCSQQCPTGAFTLASKETTEDEMSVLFWKCPLSLSQENARVQGKVRPTVWASPPGPLHKWSPTGGPPYLFSV